MATQMQPVRHAGGGIAAANVRAEMARRRVTQATVAAALGLKQQSVSSRLSGQIDFTSAELIVIGELLGIDPGSLLRDAS